MTLQEAIRNRINQLCQEQDISVSRLAARSGVPQTSVSGIFHHSNTKVEMLYRLCNGLGITLFEFFSTEEFKNLDSE